MNKGTCRLSLRLTRGFGLSWLLGFNRQTLAIYAWVKVVTAWIRDVWTHQSLKPVFKAVKEDVSPAAYGPTRYFLMSVRRVPK
jgi:hypothetical protein